MDLIDRVRRFLRVHDLASRDTRVVVAVSGGSDSIGLSLVMDALDRCGELHLAGLVHFNHQLRESAARDEQFCADVATRMERPFLADRADVASEAGRDHTSIEDAARRARYRFFERARAELGADVVALGHTRDDQAETFLLRLLRGAGSRGLASMHPRRDCYVRPLLDCRRTEVRTYLTFRGQDWVDDESNDDTRIPRNRVRHDLLPVLAQYNPAIVDVLADEASVARDEHDFIARAADRWSSIVRVDGQRVVLDSAAVAAVPTAVARELVRRALGAASAGRAISFADVDRTLELVRGHGTAFDGPHQRVQRLGPDVVLTGRPEGWVGRPSPMARPVNFFEYSLSIPGEALVHESGCSVSAEIAGPDDRGALSGRDGVVLVQLDKGIGRLAVRNRRPGDRFRPFGLGRRKKLHDFFIDRKVARERRDSIPIVVDAADRIVWVAGYAIDEAFRVTDPAQTVIILRLKGVGGSA